MKNIIISTCLTIIGLASTSCFAAQGLSDTLFSKQWGLQNNGQNLLRSSGELSRDSIMGTPGMDIDWSSLDQFEIPRDREVVVAILDSGLDISHPDLAGRIYVDRELCPDGEDNSKKPCSGINVLESNLDLTDDTGHGTHIAGIIAAIRDNKLGVAGVADSRIKVLPIKVLSKKTNEFVYNNRIITDYFADGIQYAIERGADVINMSIGWPKLIESPKMKRALEVAAEKNIAVVVAAGNNNKQVPTYPCTSPDVICVGAVDNQGKIAEFSNFGGKVDILAPGEFIVSTYPVNEVESRILRIKGYESKKGTSQAAPFIAAIVASLKLQNPSIKLDALKARLYSSARSHHFSETAGKFSKYGLVSMKKALISSPDTFLMPIFKDLLDVNFDHSNGEFFFSIPVKTLIKDEEGVSVAIKTDRKDVTFEIPNPQLNLQLGREGRVLVKGKLEDLNADNQVNIEITIQTQNKASFKARTTLFLARDLGRELGLNEEIKASKIKGFEANDLTFFRGSRKALRTTKVVNDEALSLTPAYYVQTAAAQTDDKTIVDFLRREEGSWIKKTLKVEKLHEVISIYDTDLNLDGVIDLLVMGVNVEQNRLTFDYILGQKDKTLAASRRIEFPLLDYRGFPINYKEMARFEFYSIKTDKGLLKVPAYFTNFTTPDADNTTDILDRIPSELKIPHLYYLNPIVKEGREEFELRVVDSYSLIERVRSQFQVGPWLGLFIEKPFPQGPADKRQGILRGFVTAGEEFSRRYFLYEAKISEVSFSEVFFPDSLIAGNSSRPVIGLNNSNLGQPTGDVNFVAQLKRDEVRSYVWNPLSRRSRSLEVSTNNWSDPVFDTISTFDDEAATSIFETRYFIQAFDKKGNSERLRINRESSFPGVKFSESLTPIAVAKDDKMIPGVFINSTLIFGSRLYSMIKEGDALYRPARLSVDIPKNCIHLDPEVIDGMFRYILLCKSIGSSIDMVTLPASLSSTQSP